MVEEIALKNGRISNFEGLVTLTLDRVILHTIVHHSSTFTYLPNFIEIEKTFCGVDKRTYGQIHGRIFETGIIRSNSQHKKLHGVCNKSNQQTSAVPQHGNDS